MTGRVQIGDSGQHLEAGQIATLTVGDVLHVINPEGAAELLLIGGDPLDAPIVRYGPFVMNTRSELEQAFRDYHAGRMGVI